MRVYQIEKTCEAFDGACTHFERLIEELNSPASSGMQHGEVEELINVRGMEILRLLFQGYLDVRADREELRSVVKGADGKERSHCRKNCERSLMSMFGEVEVHRMGYSARKVDSLFPLDGELNLAKDKYSDGLRRRVAQEVAVRSFDEAVLTIKDATAGRIAKRQIEQLAVEVSKDFDAFYADGESAESDRSAGILVATTDSKGIVMLEEDLRPATRKAAREAPRDKSARLSPGEKRNRKRMATVAAVYDIEARPRSPEQVMRLCQGEQKEEKRPRATNKRVWASVEHEQSEVIQAMFDEALKRDPDRKRPWAILVDGGEQQLLLILEFLRSLKIDAILVLDFIHVLEYVWKAAHALFGVGSSEAEDWVGEQALKILKGQAQQVAEAMLKSDRLEKLTDAQAKPVYKCADYLTGYPGMLDYDQFLARGIPIATGVIEGACRHLIKDRMDLTGARWKLKRAEAVLRLRSLRSSGDFDAYWNFHRAREYQRNHESLYAATA